MGAAGSIEGEPEGTAGTLTSSIGAAALQPAARALLPKPYAGKAAGYLHYIVVPSLILVGWQLLVEMGVYPRSMLPPPTQVIAAGADLVTGSWGIAGRFSGTWIRHASASLWRVYVGFGWAISSAILIGSLIGLSRLVERLLDPTVQTLRNIPVTAWVPLSMVFFGIADPPAIFLIGLGAFFPTVVNTTHGVRQVSKVFIKAGLMMGVNHRQLLTKVIFPAALPSIFTGIRLSMGVAWVLVVVAELVAVKSGLGYLLGDAYQFYRNDVMIATMLSIGLLGFLSDRAIMVIRDRVLAWNRLETLRG